MAGTATKILRPTVDRGSGSVTVPAWTLGAGATKVAAVDPGDPVSHDNDTSYIVTDSRNIGFEQRFEIDPTFAERMALVTEVRAHTRVRDEGTTVISNKLRVVLGTSNVLSSTFSTAGTSWTAGGNNVSKAMARPGGGDWTEDDFRDSTFRLGIVCPSQVPVMRCTSLWLEVDYVPAVLTVEPHREVGSRELRLLQHEPEVYTVKLPLKFLSLGLTDMVRLAHDSVFASASVLSALSSHMLTDKWRQTPCFVLERTINFDDDTVTLKLLNAIPCLAMFWSTFTTPDDVNDDMDGMPLIHVGQELGVARTTRGYIPHPSSARSITRLSDVSPITEKRNHKGTLCELGAPNDIKDSVFSHNFGGGTPWTKTTSTGGSIVTSTTKLLFENTGVTDRSCHVTKGSGDDYVSQSWTHGGGDSRVSMWFKQTSGNGDWAYQRPNGNWWNDSTQSWSATLVWNASSGVSDDWFRVVSKKITGLSAGTVTVRFGLNAGLANDELFIGSVNHIEDDAIYSDIPTDENGDLVATAGTTTTDADEIDYSLDNGGGLDERQVMHPSRIAHRFTMEAEQDSDGIVEGAANGNILGTWTWGSGVTDYDQLVVEKSSGQVRVAYERVVSSTSQGKAFKNITLVRGQVYEIAVTVTSASGGELGKAALSCTVYVDEVAGSDVTFSNEHSSSQQETHFYPGCGPAGLSKRPAMNWIRNLEILQRVLPAEEIGARR